VSEQKHTPGPWREFAPEIDGIVEENYRTICGGADLEPGVPNSQWGYEYFDISGYISPANARLIAAAPDLLEALESLLPGLVLDLRYASADDDRDAMRHRIKTVTDALAKAFGSAASDTGAK
jgi:hypothetical protein